MRLTRRDLTGTRSTCTLPITWERGCVSTVIATIATLRDRMDQQGLSLPAAAQLLAADPAAGPIDWPALVAEHLVTRDELRATTRRDLETRLERLLASLTSRPLPRDGPELLRAYARQHFAASPPGGQGRRRQIGDVARFLRWAVERRGAPCVGCPHRPTTWRS